MADDLVQLAAVAVKLPAVPVEVQQPPAAPAQQPAVESACICSGSVPHAAYATPSRIRVIEEGGAHELCDTCYTNISKWFKLVRDQYPANSLFKPNDTLTSIGYASMYEYARMLQEWKPCKKPVAMSPCNACDNCYRVIRLRIIAARKQALSAAGNTQPQSLPQPVAQPNNFPQPNPLQLSLYELRAFTIELYTQLLHVTDPALHGRILQKLFACIELHSTISARAFVGGTPEQQTAWMNQVNAATNPFL